MIIPKVAKHTRPVLFVVCACLLTALPVRGQAPPVQQGEIKAVARISKELIQDVAGRKEIVAAIPYCNEKVLGFRCQGVINGRAKLSVDMKTGQGESTFIIDSQGTAETYAWGVRGPVVAMGPAWGPFTTRTWVRFDGRRFYPDANRAMGGGAWGGGARGRATWGSGRACCRPFGPSGGTSPNTAPEAEATPIGEKILKNFVDGLGDKIVTKLNQTTPIEKSLNRLFPDASDWVFQLSTDSEFIQAAYGPRVSEVPVLPKNPGQLKDVRVELWLRSTTKEAQALEALTKRPLAKELVKKYIEATLPELAALSKERTVTAVGPWLVLSIGAPETE